MHVGNKEEDNQDWTLRDKSVVNGILKEFLLAEEREGFKNMCGGIGKVPCRRQEQTCGETKFQLASFCKWEVYQHAYA